MNTYYCRVLTTPVNSRLSWKYVNWLMWRGNHMNLVRKREYTGIPWGEGSLLMLLLLLLLLLSLPLLSSSSRTRYRPISGKNNWPLFLLSIKIIFLYHMPGTKARLEVWGNRPRRPTGGTKSRHWLSNVAQLITDLWRSLALLWQQKCCGLKLQRIVVVKGYKWSLCDFDLGTKWPVC